MKTIVHLVVAWIVSGAVLYAANYTEADIGRTISGGASEKYDIWDLGEGFGEERTFRITWDMYGIPDRVSLQWNSPTKDGDTFATPYVSYDGSHEITLKGGARKLFVIFNQGGNPDSGTAWEYRIEQVGGCSETVLYPQWGTDVTPEWRAVLLRDSSGGSSQYNRWVTRNLKQDFASESCQNKDFEFRVYKISVPSGLKALRVMSPRGVYLAVKRDSKPKPGQHLPSNKSQGSSRNDAQPNMVLIVRPDAGDFHIICAKRKGVDFPGWRQFTGNTHNGLDNNLAVDSIYTGEWRAASAAGSGADRQWIAVGVVPTYYWNYSSPIAPSSAKGFTLVSHGRTDSPDGMWEPAVAAEGTWKRTSFHVHWSQGAHWNTAGGLWFNSPRFIPSAAVAVSNILKEAKVATDSIDFIGHSYGTYFGSHLSRLGGFNRFFALDPARTAFDYSTPVTFRNSRYSMAIRAGYDPKKLIKWIDQVEYDIASNPDLTKYRAEDSVLVKSNTVNPLTNHSLPVKVFSRILAGQCPRYVTENFGFAIQSPAGVDRRKRLWQARNGYEAYLWANYLGNMIGMYRPLPAPAGKFGKTGFWTTTIR